MRSAKTPFVIAAATALIGISAVAVAAQTPRSMQDSSASREIADRLQKAVQDEMQHGCVEDDPAGGKRFCGASKERMKKMNDDAAREADALRARPAHMRTKATDAITSFMKDGGLTVRYQATSANPYSEDSLMETYADDRGNEYWINPTTDALIQAGPSASGDPQAYQARPSVRIPVAALRQKATEMILSQMPDFMKRKSALHPLEDNKGGDVYFFRWDDFASPVKETDMPPFIQVGLMADGSFASFTNTLIR